MRFLSPPPCTLILSTIALAVGCGSLRAQDLPAPAVIQPSDVAVPANSAVTTGQTSSPALPDPPAPAAKVDTGNISGTVTDSYGDVVSGVTVKLESDDATDRQSANANDTGFFTFSRAKPGTIYHLSIAADGFEKWRSAPLQVVAGQYLTVTGIQLKLSSATSSVTVYSSTDEIATQQVHIEEEQRVLGFIPNFYVVYDSQNAVPLTTKLKFQMALRVSIDPISFAGAAFLAGINQAADTPDYQQGAKGYGQRFGAVYADGLTDILFGGAILPSLLHQDPRYFYQGSGTIKSRTLHALANPFICKGDNGKWQPNYSSMGGDLISSSLSNLYYPDSNRGAGFVFENFAISTAEREVSSILQEFVVRKFTPSARRRH